MNEAAQFGGVAGGKDPRRIEVPNGLQRRQNGGLGRLRRKHDEVPRETRIVGMQPGEIQVEIDQRGHQVGLARPHRQTEKIIRVNEVVQERVEKGIPVPFLAERIVLDHLGQFFQFVRLGKAVKEFGRGISA